jgi:uncharacterized protein involved in type VI secretion and phage assembly
MAVAVDRALEELLEHLRSRFYGKYRGVVTDVDPATCRIKANVPAVYGAAKSGWCLPCVPYAGPNVGFFFVPDPGAAVWIEFEGGDVSYPIWTGCFWRADELPSEAAPTTRGIVTSAPHQLLFDDDAEEVTLADSNNGSLVLDGSGVTTTRGSGTVVVGDSGVSLNNDALKVV